MKVLELLLDLVQLVVVHLLWKRNCCGKEKVKYTGHDCS
jgi:hypothetical protein